MRRRATRRELRSEIVTGRCRQLREAETEAAQQKAEAEMEAADPAEKTCLGTCSTAADLILHNLESFALALNPLA